MRVALITSWPPELCGIASHNVNLVKHKQPEVDYKIVEGCAWARPYTDEQVIDESQDCDIVHLSYERNLHAGLTPAAFWKLKEQGKKLVMTYHNVWPGDHQDDEMLEPFDSIISQDPESPKERGFDYIPQGVMEIKTVPDDKVENKIGTAGFPSIMKGGHHVAAVARELGMGMLYIAPASTHANALGMAKSVRSYVPDAEVVHDFLSQEEVAMRLSECKVTIWAYATHAGVSGISGSVRLGIAAKRPMVVSRCGMYRDLFQEKYQNEIYLLDTDTPTAETMLPTVIEALKGEKRPNQLVKDMSWWHCGKLYASIYRRLMREKLEESRNEQKEDIHV